MEYRLGLMAKTSLTEKKIPVEIAQHRKKWVMFFLCIGLTTVIIIAYEPIRHNDFVGYDDIAYIVKNPHVNNGITQISVIWAFTKIYASNWHPLTWISHMLDCHVFGLNPLGHHLASLSIHIFNALLLFWILSNITGTTWASAFVAAMMSASSCVISRTHPPSTTHHVVRLLTVTPGPDCAVRFVIHSMLVAFG